VISTEATGRAMPQYGRVWPFITSYFTDMTLGIPGTTAIRTTYWGRFASVHGIDLQEVVAALNNQFLRHICFYREDLRHDERRTVEVQLRDIA
jgi:hypothetical protein